MRIKGGILFIAVSCMGTALAMAFSGQEDTSTVVVDAVAKNHSSVKRSDAGQHEQATSDVSFELSAIKRAVPGNIKTSGLFQSKSWYAPPPPPPVASSIPPPQPTAPPLSFTYIGRMIDGSEVTLFLYKNDQQYTVKVNDVLDTTYRVDKITDNSAVLTYLPMNIQQTLFFNTAITGNSSLSASALSSAMQLPLVPQIKQQPNDSFVTR